MGSYTLEFRQVRKCSELLGCTVFSTIPSTRLIKQYFQSGLFWCEFFISLLSFCLSAALCALFYGTRWVTEMSRPATGPAQPSIAWPARPKILEIGQLISLGVIPSSSEHQGCGPLNFENRRTGKYSNICIGFLRQTDPSNMVSHTQEISQAREYSEVLGY
jgi:hypothetical protein